MKTNQTHLVSIIIPTYNRAHLIKETLDTILEQTYKDWECIIIDDGSTDNTLEVLEQYCKKDMRFQFFERPINRIKGPNSCRNYGFELSKGNYIKWFDSDDLFYDLAIEEIVSKFKDNDVIVSQLEYYREENLKKIKTNNIYSLTLIEDYFVGNVVFYVSGPTWKRSFLEQQKYLFDESLSNLDDWDFNLRMLYQEPSITYIHQPLIKYRIHDNSLSKEIDKLNFEEIQSEFKAREKHVRLLEDNRKVNSILLKKYIKNRYKYILRESLTKRDSKRYFFLKKLLENQFRLFDFLGIIKTIFGFLVFTIFKKGYILLK